MVSHLVSVDDAGIRCCLWYETKLITLPETNSSHLKMDGWNTTFLLGWPIFRGELLVSGRVWFTFCPGAGFKDVLFSPLFEEDFQFDEDVFQMG